MEALFFNVCSLVTVYILHVTNGNIQADHGFLEGMVRGYKAGLLNQGHYSNLTQCETIEGKQTHSFLFTVLLHYT